MAGAIEHQHAVGSGVEDRFEFAVFGLQPPQRQFRRLAAVFIPIVGEFVIPDLLAGSDSLMIGQTLWLEFFTNKDWPVASAAAVILLLLLLAPLLLYDRLQRRQLEAAR